MPDAEFKGALTAFESHAVNALLSKHLGATLPADHFHIASFCMQHRTGSVVEQASQKWNLLPGAFCLAYQLGNEDFYDHLESSVKAVLIKHLEE
eukprot:6812003-Karenia_brevis.AAC.1